MLYRKIEVYIENYLKSESNKVLIIDGARQIGKTYIIRHVGKKLFPNFIEINLLQDFLSEKLFANTRTIDDFYLQLSMLAGDKMKGKENTLIFLDEIQAYPHLLTLLKFLKQDDRFTYIASGSLLGVTLSKTTSIPIGSIEVKHMFPLDFEEFLLANGFNEFAIQSLYKKFVELKSLDESVHARLMDLFKKYLIVGGLPDAVNSYLADKNIVNVRTIQNEIHEYYAMDAAKYDEENRLKIRRIYDMIPSVLENKKKRIVVQDIENKKGKRYNDYRDEFDYLINSGIALDVNAISTPVFPLIESSGKNLLKLYLNDVGLLTNILYRHNVRAILDDQKSINLGTVYLNEQTNTTLTDETARQLLETIKRQNELFEQMLKGLVPKEKKSKIGNRRNVLKFSEKEILQMPTNYRNVFAANDIVVHYRLRKDGVYEARFHRQGIDIEVSSKNLAQLKQKFIDRLNHKDEPKKSKHKEKTFADYAKEWLNIKRVTTKQSTYTEYVRMLNHDILPKFGGMVAREIDRSALQNFLLTYVDKGVLRTANKLFLVLRCIFDMIADDYGISSPMKKVVVPNYESKSGVAFTYEEEKRLVDYCLANLEKDTSHAFLVLIYTGLRRSELASLNV